MSVASNLERQMLDLINAERSSRGLAPVQLELRLNDAAEDHSRWMLQVDQFSHTGAGGSDPWDRMASAGFSFSGSWRATENIAWQSVRGAPGLSDDVQDLHTALMNSPGHRANILDPNVTVVGIGIELGKYLHNGVNYDAVMVTQNFARTAAPVQLDTGTAPTPPAPTDPQRQIVAAGTVGSDGDDWLVLQAGDSGRIDGGAGDDIVIGQSGRDVLIGRNGADTLNGRGGNDLIAGGSGDDRINGGDGNDVLKGLGDNDRLVGAAGTDRLLGGGGNDFLHGGAGNDLLLGATGDDRLVGSSGNDRLVGGGGANTLVGGGGADQFVFSSGSDRVIDFGATDLVDLRGSDAIANYADLMNNHAVQSGNDVMIDDGLGHQMILEDILLADLGRGDFLF